MLKLWGLVSWLCRATYWYPIGKSLSSQSERSFRIPKQSIVMEPDRGKKNWLEEVMRRLTLHPKTRKSPSDTSSLPPQQRPMPYQSSCGYFLVPSHWETFFSSWFLQSPQTLFWKLQIHSQEPPETKTQLLTGYPFTHYTCDTDSLGGQVRRISQNHPAVSQEDCCVSKKVILGTHSRR